MNRPFRATDFYRVGPDPSPVVSASPSQKTSESAVERATKEFAAARSFQPAVANVGAISSSVAEAEGDAKYLGQDLSEIVRVHKMIESVVDNRKSSRPWTFTPTQEWEGYVVSVGNDAMTANILDLTAREKRPSATVEIPLEELNDADIKRLQIGMIFRWAIGYARSPAGTKRRYSNLIFRDLPQWTRQEIIDARKRADDLAKFFAGGQDESIAR
jgi:hypothetical protein